MDAPTRVAEAFSRLSGRSGRISAVGKVPILDERAKSFRKLEDSFVGERRGSGVRETMVRSRWLALSEENSAGHIISVVADYQMLDV
jgi:hypothetical protein